MCEKLTYEELDQRVRELEQAESKRKIIEETNKNTSELLSFFIKHSPIYAFLKKVSHKDSQVLYASDNYIDMIGVPASQMVGKTMHELFPKEFAEKITRDDIVVINKGNNLILDEDLNGRNYVTYKFPLMQDGSKYLAGYTVDITDLKRTEGELAQIFAMSLDMICIADINNATFIKVNPAFTEILGYSEEELLGKPIFDFIHPDDIDKTRTAIVQKLQKGTKVINFENRYRCKDGSYKWLSWVSHPNPEKGDTYSVARDITERKQAERKLRESERIMRYIIKYDPNAIAVYDRNLRYIAVSDRYLQDYNVAEKNILGKHHYEVFPEMPQQWKDIHQRVLEGAIERNDDDHFERPDGSTTYNRWECRPWYTANGSIGGMITYTEVTTERKLAEQALTQSRSHLLTLVNNIPDLIWFKDQEGIYQCCNPVFERFFGAKESEIIGRTDYDFVDKDLADLFRVNDQIAMKAGRPSKNEEEITFADDGHREILETIKTPMYTDDGKLVGVLGISRDITERKQSEQALRTSHRRFNTVLNSIDANIYVADMQSHKILFMNKHMIDAFGRDMTKEPCFAAIRGESGPCACCTYGQLVDDDGKPADVYTWQEKHPITDRWYINQDRVIEWEDGRLVKFQVATDITDLKKMEGELRQAHKMDAIGTLAGGIAHDFNNILSAIIGYTELSLDDAEKGSVIEDNLNEVFAAGKRAKELVNQILAFARQSGEDYKPVRVDAVAKEVLKFIRSSIPTTIEIRPNIASKSLILGDPTQVHQILMNLCSNAAYAMEEGGGILEIGLKDIVFDGSSLKSKINLQPGNYLQLKVSDTGTGIPTERVNSIFEPYFTTKPVGEGTGMGLAVVHGIVESYGGNITVDSKVGHGTVFTIHLPIAKKQAVYPVHESEALPTGTEHILFVDDEAPIIKLGQQILERLGYRVTTRTSSLEALELFRSKSNNFDLVVSDMTMPNMTGDKLAVELLRIRSDIPVILCTGYSKKITDESANERGIKAFIHKPIVKADLAKTIRKLLDRAKAKK